MSFKRHIVRTVMQRMSGTQRKAVALPRLPFEAERWWRINSTGGEKHPISWLLAFQWGENVPTDRDELRDIHKRLQRFIVFADTAIQSKVGESGLGPFKVEPEDTETDEVMCIGSCVVDLNKTPRELVRWASKFGFDLDPAIVRKYWPRLLDSAFTNGEWYIPPVQEGDDSVDVDALSQAVIESQAAGDLGYAVSAADTLSLTAADYEWHEGLKFVWTFFGYCPIVKRWAQEAL